MTSKRVATEHGNLNRLERPRHGAALRYAPDALLNVVENRVHRRNEHQSE